MIDGFKKCIIAAVFCISFFSMNTKVSLADVTVVSDSALQLVQTENKAPVITGACVSEDNIALMWNGNTLDEAYMIYRSTSRSRGYKCIGNVPCKADLASDPSYTWNDRTVKAGIRYYYKIATAKNGKAMSFSKSKSGIIKNNELMTIDFDKEIGRFIKKCIGKKYYCNVLAKKYIENLDNISAGETPSRLGQFRNVKVVDWPTSHNWSMGDVKLSLQTSKKIISYDESGAKIRYVMKRTSMKVTDVMHTKKTSKLKPGQIIAYSRGKSGKHVAIYIGKFKDKEALVKYLNSDAVGIRCTGRESWIKDWNKDSKYWVLQGGMGKSGKDVYICNNADVNTLPGNGGVSRLSTAVTVFPGLNKVMTGTDR